jgi:hypothetical protein
MVNVCKSTNIIQHRSIVKGKNYIIVSLDAEKAFDKIQYPFIIKSVKRLEI